MVRTRNRINMHKTDASLTIGMKHPDRPEACAGEIRVALLHVDEEPQRKCRRLLATLGATAMQVSVAVTTAHDDLRDCDLIFVEAFGAITPEIEARLQWVRLVSKAPLVVLADAYRPEQAILALKAGADTVLPMSMTRDVIAARCMALLRRWHGAAPMSNYTPALTTPATLI